MHSFYFYVIPDIPEFAGCVFFFFGCRVSAFSQFQDQKIRCLFHDGYLGIPQPFRGMSSSSTFPFVQRSAAQVVWPQIVIQAKDGHDRCIAG